MKDRSSESPHTAASGEPAATSAPEGGETQSVSTVRRTLRVLVVDDDRVDRIALKRSLSQTSFEITVGEADGVLTAIDLLTRATYDCVLLDYNLPDGDGLTFLRGIRGAGISVPVIMITGQQDSAVASDLIDAGAADYIPKALFTPRLLAQSLERVFGES